MKCTHCEEELEIVRLYYGQGYVDIALKENVKEFSLLEDAHLYACTSRDCKNRGVVLVIPNEVKE